MCARRPRVATLLRLVMFFSSVTGVLILARRIGRFADGIRFGEIDETPGLAVDNPNLGRLISCPTIELRTRDAEGGEPLVFFARDHAADRTLRQLFQTVRLFQEGSDDLRTLIHMLVSNHRTRGGERRVSPSRS